MVLYGMHTVGNVDIRKRLEPILKCKACQMELLRCKDLEGNIWTPEDYCDETCREIYETYNKWFLTGRKFRVYPPKNKTLRSLDLRL